MKKTLKKLLAVLCTLVITLGFVGAKPSEVDAYSKTVTVNASLTDITLANRGKEIKVYIKFADEKSKRFVGVAKKVGSKYKLNASVKRNFTKDTSAKLVIVGPDARGITKEWSSNSLKITNSIFSKKINATGCISSATIK